MVHCVTQQQPVATIATGINQIKTESDVTLEQNFPNPFSETTSFNIKLDKETMCKMEIYNSVGILVTTVLNKKLGIGLHTISVEAKELSNGIYTCVLTTDNNKGIHTKIVVSK